MSDHAERKHAKCSPSKLKNREICPSYEGDDDADPHAITLSGTRCHEALETGDLSALDEDEVRLVGYVHRFLDRLPDPVETLDEAHLFTGVPDVDGYCDHIRIHSGRRSCDVVDFKFGWNFQGDAASNLQGQAYALGVFRAFPSLYSATVHFPYPRLNRVTEHTFVRGDIDRLSLRVATVRERWASEAGLTHVYNDANCTYCALRFRCPEVRAHFAPVLPALPVITPPKEASTPTELARNIKAARLLNNFASRFDQETRKRAVHLHETEGTEVEGFDYREVPGRWEVDDMRRLIDTAAAHGVAPEDAAALMTISVAGLTELVEDARPKGVTKRDAALAFKQDLDAAGAAHQKFDLRFVEVKNSGEDLPSLLEKTETN